MVRYNLLLQGTMKIETKNIYHYKHILCLFGQQQHYPYQNGSKVLRCISTEKKIQDVCIRQELDFDHFGMGKSPLYPGVHGAVDRYHPTASAVVGRQQGQSIQVNSSPT